MAARSKARAMPAASGSDRRCALRFALRGLRLGINELRTRARIVVHSPGVDERLVHVAEVSEAEREPAPDYRFRNVVTALCYTSRDTRNRELGVVQSYEDQFHPVTSGAPSGDVSRIPL